MSERLDLEAIAKRHKPWENDYGTVFCDYRETWPCDASLLLARVHELEAALRANMAVIGPPPIGPLYYDSAREGAWKLGEDALKR